MLLLKFFFSQMICIKFDSYHIHNYSYDFKSVESGFMVVCYYISE